MYDTGRATLVSGATNSLVEKQQQKQTEKKPKNNKNKNSADTFRNTKQHKLNSTNPGTKLISFISPLRRSAKINQEITGLGIEESMKSRRA